MEFLSTSLRTGFPALAHLADVIFPVLGTGQASTMLGSASVIRPQPRVNGHYDWQDAQLGGCFSIAEPQF